MALLYVKWQGSRWKINQMSLKKKSHYLFWHCQKEKKYLAIYLKKMPNSNIFPAHCLGTMVHIKETFSHWSNLWWLENCQIKITGKSHGDFGITVIKKIIQKNLPNRCTVSKCEMAIDLMETSNLAAPPRKKKLNKRKFAEKRLIFGITYQKSKGLP